MEQPLRTKRRTTLVRMTSTTSDYEVRLCEPECRNEYLADLGIPAAGQWKYRSYGETDIHKNWNNKDYHVTWKRTRAVSNYCDLCELEWMYRIPALVADAEARSRAMAGRPIPGGKPFRSKTALNEPNTDVGIDESAPLR